MFLGLIQSENVYLIEYNIHLRVLDLDLALGLIGACFLRIAMPQ